MLVSLNLLKRRDELLKKLSRRLGDEEDSGLRTAILFAHGGNNAAWGAGVASYLEQRSFSMGVDVMIAVNPITGFLQSKQTTQLRNIFCKSLCSSRFIKKGFLRKIVNIDYLENLLRENLNVEAIKKNPTKLFVGVTSVDGHGELIDAKAPNVDPVDALIATVTLPVKESQPKEIGGDRWVTGSLAMPIPVVETIEKFKITDLLVVLNDPKITFQKKRSANLIERHTAPLYIRPFTSGLLKAYLNRKEVCRESLARAEGELIGTCRVRVVAPPIELKTSKLSTDSHALEILFLKGHQAIRQVFGDTGDPT